MNGRFAQIIARISSLAVLLLASAAFLVPVSAIEATPSLTLRPKQGSILVGAYEPRDDAGMSGFERAIGRRVAVANSFQAWGGPDRVFNNRWVNLVKALRANGQVLMVTWEPWAPEKGADQPAYRLKAIVKGKYDSYMKSWFKQVRDTREPIFVRFAHEMNGDWYPWGTHVNTPKEYIAAWRHVVDLSRQVGADNITWVWAPNEHQTRDYILRLYPGKNYVDWIGISGYNWGSDRNDWTRWRSAKKIFGPTLDVVKRYGKPIMIAETASIENPYPHLRPNRAKAAWLARTYNYLRTVDTSISLVIYQNQRASARDWRVTTSRTSRSAIKSVLSDQRFHGMFQTN